MRCINSRGEKINHKGEGGESWSIRREKKVRFVRTNAAFDYQVARLFGASYIIGEEFCDNNKCVCMRVRVCVRDREQRLVRVVDAF